MQRKVREIGLLESSRLGEPDHDALAQFCEWLSSRIIQEAGPAGKYRQLDVHRGVVRLFGQSPSFSDPEFDIVSNIGKQTSVWRFDSVGSRRDLHVLTPGTLERVSRGTEGPVSITQVVLGNRTQALQVESFVAAPERHESRGASEQVKEDARDIPAKASERRSPPDDGSREGSTLDSAAKSPAGGGNRIEASRGSARQVDSTHTPTEDGVIGAIGPSPPTMSRAGGYVVNGILYVPEIPNIAVTKGLPVIAESHSDPSNPKSPLIRVFARIGQTTVETSSTIERAPTSTTYVDSTFEILREAYPASEQGAEIRPWTPKAMGGYRLRWPRTQDLSLMGFPDSGVCLGWQEGVPTRLQYWFPVEAIYRSLFVVGGMGGGKTNFISCLARAIANRDPAAFPHSLRPAVVILDAEGRKEYADLATEVRPELRRSLEELGIAPHGVRDFRYHSIGTKARSFRFADIPPQDTVVFPATLPTKSERAWIQGAELFWRHAQAAQRSVTAAQATAAIAGVNLPLGINTAMRAAIVRAASDSCWDVFDLPETEPLTVDELLQPGRVSVVDVSNLLGGDRIRAAGLALLTLFDVAKRRQPQHPCPIILIVDEATRLVPAGFSGASAKDYTDKMGKWLTEILHRGRRASYGLVLATQYPDDVLRGLADQPQTKVAFALAPRYDRWVDTNFSDGAGERLRELASPGVGYVARTARVEGDPQGVPHPATVIHFPQVR